MIVAARVAQTLSALGISRAYGLPGEDHLALLDALPDAGIEYRTAYNESSAVIMAATDALITGTPAVVLLSLAPGISNGFNGLLHASMEGAPVLVISGQHPAARAPFVVRQGFDLRQLMAPVTKWRGGLAAGTDVAAAVCKALDTATAERPGPVYLEIPAEVASLEESQPSDGRAVTVLADQWADRGSTRLVGAPPTERALTHLRGRLAGARRPVLIVGGRRRDLDRDTISAFSEAFRVPVLTSSAQKGIASPDDPFFAGTFLNGSLEKTLLGRSDLIIAVNPEAHDIYNRPWAYSAHTVCISTGVLDEWLYTFDHRVVADPETTLQSLIKQAAGEPSSEWTTSDVAEYRAGVRRSLLEGHGPGPSVPQIADAALSAAPAGTRIVADAGFGKPPVAVLSMPTEAGCFLASNALSTMGFAIPAAIAARSCSDRPVLAFVGDGSLLMRATELMAERRAAQPLVVVALMDASLSQIEIKQERQSLGEVGVALPRFSCAQLAGVLGIDGVDTDTVDEVAAAVRRGMASTTPLLVGARVATESSRTIFEVLRG